MQALVLMHCKMLGHQAQRNDTGIVSLGRCKGSKEQAALPWVTRGVTILCKHTVTGWGWATSLQSCFKPWLDGSRGGTAARAHEAAFPSLCLDSNQCNHQQERLGSLHSEGGISGACIQALSQGFSVNSCSLPYMFLELYSAGLSSMTYFIPEINVRQLFVHTHHLFTNTRM